MDGELAADPLSPSSARPGPSRRVWGGLVPLTALLAGLLFATSAATAQGTDLRSGRRSQLTELIFAQADDVGRQEQGAARLREQVAVLQASAAAGNSRVAAERARGDALSAPVGLTEVTGAGLTVSLDDAPRQAGVDAPTENPDDLVVHQQDVQAVVNGLWAGGAQAVTLMGQRLISTSAVRCVGNTVILHGRVYSPPFVVRAVGDPAALRDGLDAEPGVAFFKTFVDRFGLGYSVRRSGSMTLPPYDGPLELPHVSAVR